MQILSYKFLIGGRPVFGRLLRCFSLRYSQYPRSSRLASISNPGLQNGHYVTVTALAWAVFALPAFLSVSDAKSLVRDVSGIPSSIIVEVYGTQVLSAERIQDKFGGLIRRFVTEVESSSSKLQERAQQTRRELEAGVKAMGPFALAHLEKTQDPRQQDTRYMIFEVVEHKDKATRLPFRTFPKGRIQAPVELLEAWKRYSELGWEMVRKGEISMDRVDCPAFFCSWGSRTPELKAFEDSFVEQIPQYKQILTRVVHEEKDPQSRAQALYLLSYLKDGHQVSELARFALLDPDVSVREAAMRIYSDIAVHHPSIPIPIASIVAALEYPSAEDRTRALAVILGVAENPTYRPYLIREASPQILKLLRLKHPNNHHMAYAVLGLLSRQNYGARDYDAWEAWAQKARLDEATPREP